jgi:N-acetylglutamate synthase-like GNAT family acetyltransferase
VAAFAASDSSLPAGMLVVDKGQPIGVGALKAESIPSHRHLMPWAAAGYVLPQRRGEGIGGVLLRALVGRANALGHAHVYCGTSTAQSLLTRSGWMAIDTTVLDGKPLTIFRCAT